MRWIWFAAVLAACGGGGDDGGACLGAGDAGATGPTVTVRGETIVYGELEARMGRDCGEESVTIDGVQVAPTRSTDARFSVCLPDRNMVTATIDLATLEAFNAGALLSDGCLAARDTTVAASGSLAVPGFCATGEAFGIGVSGSATGIVQCAGDAVTAPEPATLTLGGGIAAVSGFVTP